MIRVIKQQGSLCLKVSIILQTPGGIPIVKVFVDIPDRIVIKCIERAVDSPGCKVRCG